MNVPICRQCTAVLTACLIMLITPSIGCMGWDGLFFGTGLGIGLAAPVAAPTEDNVVASAVIGPAGGTVEVTDPASPLYGAKVVVPPDALDADTTITIASVSEEPGLPEGLQGQGTPAVLAPTGLETELYFDVTIPYDPENGGVIGIYDPESGSWDVGSVIGFDAAKGLATIRTTHFSWYWWINWFVSTPDTIPTNFDIATDVFPVDNFTYPCLASPNHVAHCSGITAYSLWYRRHVGSGLISAYPDATAEKVACDAHSAATSRSWHALLADLVNMWESFGKGEMSRRSAEGLLTAMHLTGRPQGLLMAWFDLDVDLWSVDIDFGKGLHAVVVYKWEEPYFYIYDNVFSSDDTITIRHDLVQGMEGYYRPGYSKTYNWFYHLGTYAATPLRTVYESYPICGDGLCEGDETSETCPDDCGLYASDQTVSVDRDTAVTITLVGNDPEGQPLTYVVTSYPEHGNLADPVGQASFGTAPHTLAGNQVQYTPDSGYTGADQFKFKVNDGSVDSNTATVTLDVDGEEVCGDGVCEGDETELNCPGDCGSCVVDAGTQQHTEPGGPITPYFIFCDGVATLKGTLISGQGFRFNAAVGDTIELLSMDASPEDVEVLVGGWPYQNYNQYFVSLREGPVTIPVEAADLDSMSIVIDHQDGSSKPNISYTIRVSHTPGGTDCQGNQEPVPAGQTVFVDPGSSEVITLSGNDPDGDPLTYIIVDWPGHGYIDHYVEGSGWTNLPAGLPTEIQGNQIRYRPLGAYTGADDFKFKVNDGCVDSSATGTVVISVE